MRLTRGLLVCHTLAGAVVALKWSQTKHVLAFGDSYTYVSGTMGHANFR